MGKEVETLLPNLRKKGLRVDADEGEAERTSFFKDVSAYMNKAPQERSALNTK